MLLRDAYTPKVIPGINTFWGWPLSAEVDTILLLICSKSCVPEFPKNPISSLHTLALACTVTLAPFGQHAPTLKLDHLNKKWQDFPAKPNRMLRQKGSSLSTRFGSNNSLIWPDSWIFRAKNIICQLAWYYSLPGFHVAESTGEPAKKKKKTTIYSLEAWWVLERSLLPPLLNKTLEIEKRATQVDDARRLLITLLQHSNGTDIGACDQKAFSSDR